MEKFDHEFTITLPPSLYRAWHRSAKQMFYSRETDFSLTNVNGDTNFHNPVSFNLGNWSATRIVDYDEDGNAEVEAELAYMRNTGLQDKNGVDIYEGDVLNITLNIETTDDSYWRDENAAVVWDEDGWTVSGESLALWTQTDDWDRTCQVIGNIYENSELLK